LFSNAVYAARMGAVGDDLSVSIDRGRGREGRGIGRGLELGARRHDLAPVDRDGTNQKDEQEDRTKNDATLVRLMRFETVIKPSSL
jgi:hypothetical protein